MKNLFLMAIIAILFNGCDLEELEKESQKCEKQVNYFCFFNQVQKVEECGDDINSSLVYEDDNSTVKSCSSTVIYEEIIN